ncbi:MAG: NUDIX hydrolase [Planctomycetota bacterium]
MNQRPIEQPGNHDPRDYPDGAVVAVVHRAGRFLAIKRSRFVKAPGTVCFAGGGVEAGESKPDAIVREMQEELGVSVTPVARVHIGKTPSGVDLHFWQVRLSECQTIVPNEAEVESFGWYSTDELRTLPDLLVTANEFIDLYEQGIIQLAE